jgi:signal transduction histidine kinase
LIRPALLDQRAVLHFDAANTRNLFVLADRQRLRQVILNLLSNAIKYNRTGGAVRLECMVVQDNRVRVRVSDDGPGIAPEYLPRLFTPFDRLGAETSGIEGTGLGLILSRELVEAMGGTIGVESHVGQGSTFWFELTLATNASDTQHVQEHSDLISCEQMA